MRITLPANAPRLLLQGFADKHSIMDRLCSNIWASGCVPCQSTEYIKEVMKRALQCADWVEHVVATGGKPYLRTPESEMSFVVRNSLDVYTVIAAMCCLALGLAHAVLGIVLRRCKALISMRSSNGTRNGCVPISGKVSRLTST